MTDYRAIVRHVRWWRGNIHRWSTSYEFTGSGTTPNTAACTTLATNESPLLYDTSTTGKQGGIYEVQFYLASGGTPVASETFFDYTVPTAWTGYNGAGWGATRTATPDPLGEVALGIRWQAGYSSTGKPVFFRKWYHSVPVSNVGGGNPDIGSTVQTSLAAAALTLQTCLAPTYGLSMGNSRRLASTTPVVSPYYENHQMPRGRRRKGVVFGSGSGKVSISPGKYPSVPPEDALEAIL